MQPVTAALGLGFVIDLALGDPPYSFHPIRLMGQGIEKGEAALRQMISDEKKAGAVLAFGVPALVFLTSWFVIGAFTQMHPILGLAAEIFGIYSALSIRDLQQEAQRILQDLKKDDLETARRDLGRIVGRDTEALEKPEILRASIEAVSESAVDGIIAPLFYAALGGAPLALAYKAVNTLDSMIGHQNEKYQHFGFFAAKQDEFWNWLPARLSWLLTGFTVFAVGGNYKKALAWGWRDGILPMRGNSAVPEASFAGALGVQLGGPSTYQGRKVEKPFLGIFEKEITTEDLEKSIYLMLAVSWASLAMMLLLRGILGIF